MPAGVYEISVTYTAGGNLTTDMGLDLYDGVGNWIGQVGVNEQIAPTDFTEHGVGWKRLGSFKLTSNIFHISTWNSPTDGAICVNGIELRAVPVIDDSDAPIVGTHGVVASSGTFSTAGTWTTSTHRALSAAAIPAAAPPAAARAPPRGPWPSRPAPTRWT